MIGIIYVGSLNRCPYLKNYTYCLDKLDICYDIISWDRTSENSLKKADINAREHFIFKYKSKELKSPILKIGDFYRFSNYVKSIIKQNNYDKLIILTTMSGIVVLKNLTKEYKGKYIFDYRDASFEYLKVFQIILKKIIYNSAFTSISSKGFLNILPKYDYVIAHNCNSFEIINSSEIRKNQKIRIGFIGGLRETEYMQSLIDRFGNDERFEFLIHGGGENLEVLSNFAKKYMNIVLTGPYIESDKSGLVKELDFICYNYPNTFVNDFALANKFYDGLLYRKPMLGNIATYSGKLIEESEVGISLDFEDPLYKDKIYNYYNKYDRENFMNKCDRLLLEIKNENKVTEEKIKSFFLQGHR